MHQHAHNHNKDADVTNIKVAFFLNLFFTIVEIIGGFMTNSLAILSDALHDLGDSFSLGLAWYFQKLSKKGSDAHYTYGYKRFSLLGAIINSIILFTGSIFIVIEAIPRLIQPQEADAKGMILFAILGVLVNGIAVLRLKKGTSHNERVAMLHLFEDVLGWTAVLIGSIIMYFFDLPIIDPLLSVGISLFILYNVVRNIRKSMSIVLQRIPDNISRSGIKKVFESTKGVKSYHDLHIWSLDGDYHVLTVHIIVEDGFKLNEMESLKNAIRHELEHEGILHSTLEIETNDEYCKMHNCC